MPVPEIVLLFSTLRNMTEVSALSNLVTQVLRHEVGFRST